MRWFDNLVDWILLQYFKLVDWWKLYQSEKHGLVNYTKVKMVASLVYKGQVAKDGKVHYIARITHKGVRYSKCVDIRRKNLSRVKEAVLINFAKKMFADGLNKKLKHGN